MKAKKIKSLNTHQLYSNYKTCRTFEVSAHLRALEQCESVENDSKISKHLEDKEQLPLDCAFALSNNQKFTNVSS